MNSISGSNSNYFLDGGGEMGALIRSINWDKTSLGSSDEWPEILKTTVRMILDTPFPMYIAWGKEYIQIYNDGYRPILGSTKHPQAMGISTRQTFSAIWHVIGPMFEDVMKGVAVGFPNFVLHLDRNGYIEKCYFDFSYSPIRCPDGEVGGVLVTVIETTEKVKALKLLKENKEQLELAVDAAELATWDYNPLSKKLLGNTRLKEWFGIAPEDEILISHIQEAVPDSEKERVIAAMNTAMKFDSGGQYDIAYNIVDKRTKILRTLRAKGKVFFGDDGVADRFMGTLMDISEETLFRNELEKSEKNMKDMVSQSPVAMTLMEGSNMVIRIANEKALELWGKRHDEVINKQAFDVFPELISQGFDKILTNVYNSGEPFVANEMPIILLRKGVSETVYVNFVYQPIKNANGDVTCIVGIGIEITELKQSREKIEEADFKLRVALEAAQIGSFDYDLINHKVTNSSLLNEIFGFKDLDIIHHKLIDAVHPDDRIIRDNAISDAYTQGFLYYEVRVVWKDGSVHWIKARGKTYYNEQNVPERIYGIISDITEQKRLLENLENLVDERTAAISDANRLLYIQNETYKLGEQKSGYGSYYVSLNTKVVTLSDNFYDMLELDPKNKIDSIDKFNALIYPEDKEYAMRAQQRVIELNEFAEWKYRMLTKSGKIIHVISTGKMLDIGDEKFIIGTLQIV